MGTDARMVIGGKTALATRARGRVVGEAMKLPKVRRRSRGSKYLQILAVERFWGEADFACV